MLDLVNLLVDSPEELCRTAYPLLRIVGYVVWGIKIAVPIILIIVGMVDLAKAVSAKDEGEVKKAQQSLIKKAIAAVLVFLVATIVGIIMTVVGNKDYKKCWDCINDPVHSCGTKTELD